MEMRTDEGDDGFLVLKEAAQRHGFSRFILNFKFRDGRNIFARRDVSW